MMSLISSLLCTILLSVYVSDDTTTQFVIAFVFIFMCTHLNCFAKEPQKIERKKFRHEWIHVFTRYALWSDGVRWASDSYGRRWMKIFIRWFSRLFDCCGKIFVGSLSFLYWTENTFILALLILVTFYSMLLFLLIFLFCFDFL
jgi:hypothetical protein